MVAREWYRKQSAERKREIVVRRDAEKVRANDRARHVRHREARNAQMRERARSGVDDERKKAWARANADKRREANRRYRAANPERSRAHTALYRALKKGVLVRPTACSVPGCDTGRRIQAHHPDYAKPLEVVWLCSTHHGEVHREYR